MTSHKEKLQKLHVHFQVVLSGLFLYWVVDLPSPGLPLLALTFITAVMVEPEPKGAKEREWIIKLRRGFIR